MTGLAITEGSVALWVSGITAIGMVIGSVLGLVGVRRTAATSSEGTLRSDLLKEREDFRREIDNLEEKQADDRSTIASQRRMIRDQEERIGNQNQIIALKDRRIIMLEKILRRKKIPVPGNGDDTDPGTLIPPP